jgi:hypothetical protein
MSETIPPSIVLITIGSVTRRGHRQVNLDWYPDRNRARLPG